MGSVYGEDGFGILDVCWEESGAFIVVVLNILLYAMFVVNRRCSFCVPNSAFCESNLIFIKSNSIKEFLNV